MEKGFRTLPGFIAGTEREEGTYYAYSASLRISADIPDMDEISTRLNLKPTHLHRKGEKARSSRSTLPP
jgi:hypothetical protein